jgi:bifunctional UDP-N-acetylglucosamine pyrophosphorylase / glucosamine-1-phosphate N-acetyltransferase
MSTSNTAAIVLAAGMGTRMKSNLPKVLHPVAGRAMILQLLDSLAAVEPERIVLIVGPDMEPVSDAAKAAGYDVEVVIQQDRLGTGHAVKQAEQVLSGYGGNVLVLYGDSPLITSETMADMLEARTSGDSAVVVLGFRPFDPAEYGRLILDDADDLTSIIEAKDASEEELTNDLCNSGVMAIDGNVLFDLTSKLSSDNAKGEFYLTDIIGLAGEVGRLCAVVEGDEEELIGVNSRAELAVAETIMQDRLREAAMENGATLTDPSSVYFAYDTQIGQDVTIGPNVFFGPGVEICDGVEIRAFCHIEGAFVENNAIIGPFARLRPGADIGEEVHIGNFVEIKNATMAAGSKANHLSYIGDSKVGAKANIGAGTITCNYDGYVKSMTEIGAGAFIGSNTALVAPVKVGDGAITGAGSVITKEVEAEALAITRSEQKSVAGYATKLRDAKAKE